MEVQSDYRPPGMHATKSPCHLTPKTLPDNGFHSLSRFRRFITEWIDSRARHKYTRAQNGNTVARVETIEFRSDVVLSYLLLLRFLRCKS